MIITCQTRHSPPRLMAVSDVVPFGLPWVLGSEQSGTFISRSIPILHLFCIGTRAGHATRHALDGLTSIINTTHHPAIRKADQMTHCLALPPRAPVFIFYPAGNSRIFELPPARAHLSEQVQVLLAGALARKINLHPWHRQAMVMGCIISE